MLTQKQNRAYSAIKCPIRGTAAGCTKRCFGCQGDAGWHRLPLRLPVCLGTGGCCVKASCCKNLFRRSPRRSGPKRPSRGLPAESRHGGLFRPFRAGTVGDSRTWGGAPVGRSAPGWFVTAPSGRKAKLLVRGYLKRNRKVRLVHLPW